MAAGLYFSFISLLNRLCFITTNLQAVSFGEKEFFFLLNVKSIVLKVPSIC